MAFPGTLNINYYKGDTYEFRIYPKDSSGNPFDLSEYRNAKFTISTARGTAGVSDQIECLAVITSGLSGNYVTCTIRPGDSVGLSAITQYVYDVEITRVSSPHNYIYTLITGTLNVTDQVGQTTIPSVTYTVKYLSDPSTTYGSYPIDSNRYVKDQHVTIKNADGITNPGNIFDSWNTSEDGSGTSYAPGSTLIMGNANITLHAQWTEEV